MDDSKKVIIGIGIAGGVAAIIYGLKKAGEEKVHMHVPEGDLPVEVINIVPIPPYEDKLPGEITAINVTTPGDDTGESYLRQLLADFAAAHVANARGQKSIYLPSLGKYVHGEIEIYDIIGATARELGIIPADAMWGGQNERQPLGSTSYSSIVGYVGDDSGVSGAGAYIGRFVQYSWWRWVLTETVFY